MFGLKNPDYETIIDDYLPLLKQNGFDVYFNGHEHIQSYGFTGAKDS